MHHPNYLFVIISIYSACYVCVGCAVCICVCNAWICDCNILILLVVIITIESYMIAASLQQDQFC
eukprot:UN11201